MPAVLGAAAASVWFCSQFFQTTDDLFALLQVQQSLLLVLLRWNLLVGGPHADCLLGLRNRGLVGVGQLGRGLSAGEIFLVVVVVTVRLLSVHSFAVGIEDGEEEGLLLQLLPLVASLHSLRFLRDELILAAFCPRPSRPPLPGLRIFLGLAAHLLLLLLDLPVDLLADSPLHAVHQFLAHPIHARCNHYIQKQPTTPPFSLSPRFSSPGWWLARVFVGE